MDRFMKIIADINKQLSAIVWGWPALLLILLAGMIFTFGLGGFQFKYFNLWIRHTLLSLFKNRDINKRAPSNGISSFQALTTALAGCIGTGNIVGVATALTLGGAGAIFWMWISALLGMMTVFAEIVLGIKYRTKNANGEWVGGAMYYIEKGVGVHWLGVAFAIACVFASLGMGNMAQANSIACALNDTFFIQPAVTGVIAAILIGIIIFGGIKRIAKVTEKIVPFMACFYILGGLIIILVYFNKIPFALKEIFSQAFSFKAAAGGAGGYIISRAMRYGVSRGIFTNEAGLGSSSIVHAAADVKEPVEQGMWGIFQVFVDTIVICTITALCIICTGVISTGKEGAALSAAAFNSVFGSFGGVFVSVGIVFFAFSSMLGWSYYGERGLEYIAGKKLIHSYRIIFAISAIIGATMDLSLVWDISDTLNGFMAIPNIIALFLLSGQVIQTTRAYLSRKNIARK